MKQIGSGITGSRLAVSAVANLTGLQHGETGSGVPTVRSPVVVRNAGIVEACLKRLNASRRKATANDWTPEDMALPEILRPIWTLDGDANRLRGALSLTCSLAEAAEAVGELRAMTRMSNEQMDRGAEMIERFTRRMTDYPPLVVLEVVSDWTETEKFFPGSWSDIKDRLDMVRGSLEALAK